MSDKLSIWNDGFEVLNALTPFYQEEAVNIIREAKAMDSWFILLQAAAVEPAPLQTARVLTLAPYNAAVTVTERIDKALEGGFVTGDDENGYRLTDNGRAALDGFFNTAHGLITEAPVLPPDDMERLASLLRRVVEATEDLEYPDPKPNLENSRWTDPWPDASATVLVDQYLTDLRLFRDDAHIAAWQVNDIDGRSWETLTFIWRDDAHDAHELLEKLPRRGYSAEDYTKSLDILAQKDWIGKGDEGWQLTEEGRAVREKAERKTDQLFFAGWETLSEDELTELGDLLANLLAQLKESAPAPEPA